MLVIEKDNLNNPQYTSNTYANVYNITNNNHDILHRTLFITILSFTTFSNHHVLTKHVVIEKDNLNNPQYTSNTYANVYNITNNNHDILHRTLFITILSFTTFSNHHVLTKHVSNREGQFK
ncbi:hypothetical protein EMUR_03855 [Ehrlichia muris AS145]|uniref:Uncharacterized protein n=1 Tax=Ehrlichia muris AS145 TaxID=1423892 RepID=V9RAD6_9RICK|nr:hypothetical protein EMUR_03855 [Ehrlichia muris AS145]